MQKNVQLDLGNSDQRPRRGSDRGRPLFALLCIVILAGVLGWFWLARDPEARQELTRRVDEMATAFPQAANMVDSVTATMGGLVDSALQGRAPAAPPEPSTSTSLPGAPPPLVGTVPQASTTPQPDDSQTGSPPTLEAGNPLALNGGSTTETAGRTGAPLSTTTNATLPSTSTPATSSPAMAQGSTNGTKSAPHTPVTTAPEGTDPFTGGVVLQGGASQRGSLTPEGAPPPVDAGRKDDMVVRVAFIDDLATWLVSNYLPGKKRGNLQASLQAANLRYGVGMRGLYWIGDDLPKGRSEALQYVFTPSMLDALYRLYIDRFMQSMAEAGDNPEGRSEPLSPAQRSDMYAQYAKRFRGMAGTLQSVASMPDFLSRGDTMRVAAQKVVEANARYSELVYQQDQARESGNTARQNALAPQVQAAAQAYQQAVVQREHAREAFARALAKNPAARSLDDETRVYVGQWVERRVRENKNKMDAAQQAATIFQDLAQRFEQAAGVEN